MDTLRRMIVAGGVVGILVAVVLALAIDAVFAQETVPGEPGVAAREITQVNSRYYMAVVLGAALAAGFGFLGGGYAVARVGAAALGAASERPELLTRSLVFVALGEGIAIFGLVVAILMVLRLPQ
ncbi:MAG TPA: ATP synthase subunit C [Planctomycetota bacterium]|nr:ATP synthase subunit C [Planctomycetota bacterium]